MTRSDAVIWHDLECGGYEADLPLWSELAAGHDGPVLDVGAGTGRVALALARAGVEVIALDRDRELLAELKRRAVGLPLQTVCGDARDFTLPGRVGLCLAPMQTVQLLGGADGRARFLRCVAAALAPDGMLAAAIATELEPFDVAAGFPEPLPDVGEFDETVYCSRAVAIRPDGDGFVLERHRETVAPDGVLHGTADSVHLDRLSAETLEAEGTEAGLRIGPRRTVAETPDYAGSTVVALHAR